jgi:hypothetical protein
LQFEKLAGDKKKYSNYYFFHRKDFSKGWVILFLAFEQPEDVYSKIAKVKIAEDIHLKM